MTEPNESLHTLKNGSIMIGVAGVLNHRGSTCSMLTATKIKIHWRLVRHPDGYLTYVAEVELKSFSH